MNKSRSGIFQMDMKNRREKLSLVAKLIIYTQWERSIYKQRNWVQSDQTPECHELTNDCAIN